MLIDGAVAGGKHITDPIDASHQIPVLNVYESLKLAAKRPSAALCGNHVYSKPDGSVWASRDASAELLFSNIDDPYTDLLNVLHGGKRIQIGDYRQFAWNDSSRSWDLTTFPGAPADYHKDAGGAFLSSYDGTDHDRITYLISQHSVAFDSSIVTPTLHNLAQGYTQKNLAVKRFSYTENISDVCPFVPYDTLTGAVGQCGGLMIPSGWRKLTGGEPGAHPQAYAPQGNFVLQGVNRRFTKTLWNQPSVLCTVGNASAKCATFVASQDSSEGFALFKIDTSGATTWIPIPVDDAGGLVRAGLNIVWVQVDETGQELVWELGKDKSESSPSTGSSSCTNRVIEYRALPGHPTKAPGTLLRPPEIRPDVIDATCSVNFGPATIAPSRIPTGGTQARPRSLSPLRPALHRPRQ